MITTGNHVYRHREVYDFLDRTDRVIRPANYPHANPGKGHTVVEAGGKRVAVINLSGGVGLTVARNPFHEVDAILARVEADAVIVDFHAEVTSEKVAMGWHLDGQVAAVLGNTHPRADCRREGVAQGNRVHLRCRDDRVAYQCAGCQTRAGPGLADNPDAGEVRDRGSGRVGHGCCRGRERRGLADSIEAVLVPA